MYLLLREREQLPAQYAGPCCSFFFVFISFSKNHKQNCVYESVVMAICNFDFIFSSYFVKTLLFWHMKVKQRVLNINFKLKLYMKLVTGYYRILWILNN